MFAKNAGPGNVPSPRLLPEVRYTECGRIEVTHCVLCRDVWNVMDISVVSCAILSFYFK